MYESHPRRIQHCSFIYTAPLLLIALRWQEICVSIRRQCMSNIWYDGYPDTCTMSCQARPAHTSPYQTRADQSTPNHTMAYHNRLYGAFVYRFSWNFKICQTWHRKPSVFCDLPDHHVDTGMSFYLSLSLSHFFFFFFFFWGGGGGGGFVSISNIMKTQIGFTDIFSIFESCVCGEWLFSGNASCVDILNCFLLWCCPTCDFSIWFT